MRDVAGIFPAMEAPQPGDRVRPGPGTRRAGRFAFWLVLAVLLGGCSTLQFSYNNAETALRYMAWDYLDANAEQSDSLQERFVRLRNWHRSSELPHYVQAVRTARERFSKGLTQADVEWGIATIRSRLRLLAARAAQDAAPTLVTLGPEQIAALERKFARENARYVEQWIAGDDRSRLRRRADRMVEQFEEWTGRLAAGQRQLIERFVASTPAEFERRIDERRRWQADLVAMLKRYRSSAELTAPLVRLLSEPETGRSNESRNSANRWESRLAALIVELDATLDAEQRARVVGRLERYRNDFQSLSAGNLAAN